MTMFDQIQADLAAITVQNAGGGTVDVVFGGNTYKGFPSTLSDRLVVQMMGSAADYQFSVVLPAVNLATPTPWVPKTDDTVAISGVDYRVAGASAHTTMTTIHLGMTAPRYESGS